MTTMAELESLELENGGLTPTNCAILLAQYLGAGDFLNAKFLWTRTAVATKKENPEIDAVWSIGKSLSAKEFQEFFALVKQRQWSEGLVPIIADLVEKTRQRVFRLVSLAYTTMQVANFAAVIDLPVEEAVRIAVNPLNNPDCRWNLENTSQMLEKVPSATVAAAGAEISQSSADMGNSDYHQRQFQVLTDYVSFLEN